MPPRWLWGCFTLELVALAIWIGGLVVIVTAVIPAVFNSFGMEPGGRFLTRVFDGYNRTTVVAIAVLVICSAARVWKDGAYSAAGRSGMRLETSLLLIMVAVAVVIMAVLGPHALVLQEHAFLAKEEAEKKQAYDAFFRTHMMVRSLYLANLGLGIALIGVKVRRWMYRS